MATELEPCPFCRKPAVEWFRRKFCCPDADCPGSRALCSLEDWNTRAPTPEGEALREIAELSRSYDRWTMSPEFRRIDEIMCRHGLDPFQLVEAHGIQLPAEEGNPMLSKVVLHAKYGVPAEEEGNE